MLAKYILAVVGSIFLLAAVIGTAAGRPRPQTRTWLIVGGILTIVSIWLFSRA